MKILVCGGRNYENENLVWEILDTYIKESPDELTIISGMAKGADTFAADWANYYGIELLKFPADWQKYAGRAGPIRNHQMLKEGKPDLVIAFPGNKGTHHMCTIAKQAGVPVIRIGEKP